MGYKENVMKMTARLWSFMRDIKVNDYKWMQHLKRSRVDGLEGYADEARGETLFQR
jgi:hypothetical protein